MSTAGISYAEGGPELFGRVKPLWERIRAHHEGISTHFRDKFSEMNFPARRRELLKKGERNGLRIFLARDAKRDRDAGYCIATMDPLRTAEVDSLYVDGGYRGKKIGEVLLTAALRWIQRKKPTLVNIFVAVGNERALGFYKKFNFVPYTILLRKKT